MFFLVRFCGSLSFSVSSLRVKVRGWCSIVSTVIIDYTNKYDLIMDALFVWIIFYFLALRVSVGPLLVIKKKSLFIFFNVFFNHHYS